MNECDRIRQVHAYHDNELSAAQRSQVEAHLQTCAACSAELARLESMATGLRASPLLEAPAGLAQAVRDAVNEEAYRPALRMARWLTAAAAAIVVVCLPNLVPWPGAPEEASALPMWEVAAVGADPAAAVPHEQLMARWLAQDLAGRSSTTMPRSQQP